jgi:hypothetical protein
LPAGRPATPATRLSQHKETTAMWYRHSLYQPSDYVAHTTSGFIPNHSHFLETVTLTIVVQSGVS